MTPDRGPAPPAVVDPAAVRRALRDAGLRARHSLSQNFLADAEVLDAILAEASPRAGDRILEIGPGLGVLTAALLAAGAAVAAVELDEPLAARLRAEQATAVRAAEPDPDAPGALRVVTGDALDVDLVTLARPPYAVVANLPYHITSPILHRLLGSPPRPTRLVLMVQREVAERIAAPPGGMSYLSVFVQFHAVPRIARIVPAAAFEPAPAVDSAILVLEVRPSDERTLPDGATEDDLWRLVQAGFRERRKMLHNVLARQLPVGSAAVDAALAGAGIAPDRRPQTLSVEEWIALLGALRAEDAPAGGAR
ncbi:MAG TPA: 16S rRNA (adenine(1518)-N(6)/adenine(1519)-N(6))-dimethyltransferase RsmA [Candidatus Limnocylindrales bacterium]|nr:16S rRNA (adenine(1518)-N(6)/adenine(1519)-N(6))-dimethyltransferase RsmA [Candidatus Limnocylindrales bacterium]